MNCFKKVLCILLICLMALGTVACGGKTSEEDETYTQMDLMKADLSQYVDVGQYKGIEFEVDPVTVSEGEIDAIMQELVDSKTTYEQYETAVTNRAAAAGDYCEINFKGYLDGELFEGGTADGVPILLGENNGFIDWFEDDLYGVMPGNTVESTGKFPDDYREEYAGREVTFSITLVSIKGHYTIPKLTDAFVAEETEYSSVVAYRNAIHDALMKEAVDKAMLENYNMMWQHILENATFIELPEQQVMYYYTSNRSYYESVAAQYGYTYEEYLEAVGGTDADIMTAAENMVKEELVFYSIAKLENASIDDTEYAEGVAKYAEAQGVTVEQLEESYTKEYIIDNLLWDEVIYSLAAQNTFTVK